MGSFKRDYSHVEKKDVPDAYAGDVPKPGIYDAVLTSVKEHPTANSPDGQEWIFEISDGPYKGWPGWVYTNGSTTAWKEVQILEATGLMKDGDTSVDLTHEKILKKAGPVRVKIKNEVHEEEKRGKITTIMAPPGGASSKAGGKKEKASDDPF